jgi:hypothetical protein
MRTGTRVHMPRHLRYCRVTWQRAIQALTAAAILALWATAIVMVVR